MTNRLRALRHRHFIGAFCFGFAFFLAAPAMAQSTAFAETEKIKDQVSKIGRGRDVTIVRHDGHEFYGRIMKIGDDFVAVSDVDEKAEVEIDFAHIRKITRGYGSVRSWNGKRIAPKKNI